MRRTYFLLFKVKSKLVFLRIRGMLELDWMLDLLLTYCKGPPVNMLVLCPVSCLCYLWRSTVLLLLLGV